MSEYKSVGWVNWGTIVLYPRAARIMTHDHVCNLCGDSAALICSGCDLMSYCGKDHQRIDWQQHRVVCKSKVGIGARLANIGDPVSGDDEQRGLINAVIRAAYYVGETINRVLVSQILAANSVVLDAFVQTTKQMLSLAATGSVEFVCDLASKLPEFISFLGSLLGDSTAPNDINRDSFDYIDAKAAAQMCQKLFSRAASVGRWMIDLVRQAGLIMLQGLD